MWPCVWQAEELFSKAIELKPWDGGLYQTLGVLLHKSGRIDRARLLFKQGSLAAKHHPPLWQAWALMEADAGKVVYMYTYINIYMYDMRVCNIYMYMYVCICMCICIRMYDLYICIYMYMYMFLYMHLCMYVFI